MFTSSWLPKQLAGDLHDLVGYTDIVRDFLALESLHTFGNVGVVEPIDLDPIG
jgi:hypothetical protein